MIRPFVSVLLSVTCSCVGDPGKDSDERRPISCESGGPAPVIETRPSALEFGEVGVGESALLIVTASVPEGEIGFVCSLFQTGSAAFAVEDADVPVLVSAAAPLEITVTYTPMGTQSDSGELRVRGADPDASDGVVGLTGAGAP